jgi:hypothetical protein
MSKILFLKTFKIKSVLFSISAKKFKVSACFLESTYHSYVILTMIPKAVSEYLFWLSFSVIGLFSQVDIS